VHFEPDYILPLALAEGVAGSHVLFVDDGPRTVVAAIMSPERRAAGPTHIPVQSTSCDFLKRETGHTFPLVDGDDPEAAIELWFDAAAQEGLGGTVWFADLYEDGPLVAAIRAVTQRRALPTVTFGHGYLPYLGAGDWPPLADLAGKELFDASHLPRGRRQDMRRSLRLAEDALGDSPSWLDRTAEASAVDDFIRLQAAGWKGDATRGGYAFGLNAARSGALREIVETFRAEDRLLIGSLVSGNEVLYLSISLRGVLGTWTTPFDAYDERFASIGVGRLGRLAVLRYLTSRYPDADIDPCFIDVTGSIGGLFPRQRPTIGMLVGVGGIASRTIVRIIAARERSK
jgi:hypothetical protein